MCLQVQVEENVRYLLSENVQYCTVFLVECVRYVYGICVKPPWPPTLYMYLFAKLLEGGVILLKGPPSLRSRSHLEPGVFGPLEPVPLGKKQVPELLQKNREPEPSKYAAPVPAPRR